uniref:Uncharacterized protein n=1 Tax=Rhizophora mucronata TaxID=61149 RepID=A0A2P2QYF2_RHIMU
MIVLNFWSYNSTKFHSGFQFNLHKRIQITFNTILHNERK